MADNKKIVLTDDSLNRRKFRVLTSGINTEDFKKNPVMLFNHHRSVEWNLPGQVGVLPIGRWAIEIQGDKLIGDPTFDEKDDFAVRVKQKFEDGFLNSASIGIEIIEISEDPALMLPGQTRPTITKSNLLEVSITDIPANANATALSIASLSFGGKTICLSDNMTDEDLNTVLKPFKKQSKSINMNKDIILSTLSLSKDSTDAQVIAKITEHKNASEKLGAEVTDLKKKLSDIEIAQMTEKVNNLVNEAVKAGKLTEVQKPIWLSLAKKDYAGAKLALDAMAPYKRPSEQLSGNGESAALTTDAERYMKLDKEGKLGALKNKNLEEYNRLEDAYLSFLKGQGVIG